MSRSREISLCLFSALLLISSGNVFSSITSDVRALTGNRSAKFVWVRWQWCNADYSPKQEQVAITSLENDANPYTQLMIFDTDQGTPRFLDSAEGSHVVPRFTRSGTHVIWVDESGKIAWIRDCAGAAPKRKLIDGGDYYAVACQWDPVTRAENVYFESVDEKSLYKVPLKADYTVDLTQKALVYQSADKFDRLKVSVSEDGAYIGAGLPWPQTMMVKVSNGQRLGRRAPGSNFGCEPNIAPDKSYRFFHNFDDHMQLRMWDANLSDSSWFIPVDAGVPLPGTAMPWKADCAAPRWTNDVRFLTNSFPLQGANWFNYGKYDIFGMSAQQVKAENPSRAGFFCLGKFSADFRSIEKYIRISDGDIRHRDVCGDGWIAGAASRNARDDVNKQGPERNENLNVHGRLISATSSSAETVALTVIGPNGQVVSNARGNGTVQCSLTAMPAGVYIALVAGAFGTVVSRLAIE